MPQTRRPARSTKAGLLCRRRAGVPLAGLVLASAVGGTLATDRPAVAATAPAYRLVDLGVIGTGPAGSRSASASDINASGTIVGASSYPGGSSSHAFAWRSGTMRDLGDGLDGSASSAAAAVNDLGVVAGSSHVISQHERPHAVLWRDGRLVDLGTGYGRGSGSSAADLNRHGLVVGTHYRSVEQPRRAAVWSRGQVRDLGTLGGRSAAGSRYDTESEAHAVNDVGQVVGAALPASGHPLRGFLWEKGVMRDLGTLGGRGEATVATGINENGDVVGFSQSVSGETHAFLWREGRMRDLGVLGPDFPYRSSSATDVNDAGVVVGQTRVRGGAYGTAVGFVWRSGVMTDLNTLVQLPPGQRIDVVEGINNAGVIVGRTCEIASCSGGGPTRAIALVPQ